VSNYGSHHFSSGIAETDHIETGQQRMQVPVYEDLAAYTRNSAVFGVSAMTTPLLIEVGDADGTVFWHQGVELYNAARRARKDVGLARCRRGGPGTAAEGKPGVFPRGDQGVVGPLPEARAGRAVDHEGRELPRRGGGGEGRILRPPVSSRRRFLRVATAGTVA